MKSDVPPYAGLASPWGALRWNLAHLTDVGSPASTSTPASDAAAEMPVGLLVLVAALVEHGVGEKPPECLAVTSIYPSALSFAG